MRMKRIYVAGAYSADSALAVFDNMRRGIRLSILVRLAGYAPFCPWLDYHYQLGIRGDERLTVDHYYDHSMAWLEAADAVLVATESEDSKGTAREIRRAIELDIPIYYSLSDLKEKESTRI